MPGEMDDWADELLQDWGFSAESSDPGAPNVGVTETSEAALIELVERAVPANPG
jgi:hypothetical protein